jgi:phosphatidylserine decarboxylase
VIIRLAPFDYHRFHFPISGGVSPVTRIDGDYYSVNPLALRKMTEIFCLNKREFTIISNPLFGDVVMYEVGATMAGSIVQTYTGKFIKKGEEKGYLNFGVPRLCCCLKKTKFASMTIY